LIPENSSGPRDLPELTVFGTTKPFRGDIATIQLNALRSWRLLDLRARILVFGDSEGTAAACKELGIQHVPDIETNGSGTPLVSAMFTRAEQLHETALYCYVNADIILLSDFAQAVRRVARLKRFLMVGRRWDVPIDRPWAFATADWEGRLVELTRRVGIRHPATGIDYFVYSSSLWGSIKPFAVGRTGWDSWLVYRARALRAPVVDATDAVMAVHQNHDYSHHADGASGVWQGGEASRNRELVGGQQYAFTIDDATHTLTDRGVRLAFSRRTVERRIAAFPVLHPGARFSAPIIDLAGRLKRWTSHRLRVN